MVAVNEVRLVGRLSAEPVERELPSGDTVMVSRLVVSREGESESRSRQTVDVLDCSGWSPRVQRAMRGWSTGDVVEVKGSVRRRFYQLAGQTAARVEIEVSSARRVRRAGPG
jgi:single-strand DNA-binding protein